MKHASGKQKTAVVAAPKVKKFQPKNSAKTVKTTVKKAFISAAQSKPKKKKPAVSAAQAKGAKNKSSVVIEKNKSATEKTRAISARSAKTVKPEISAKKNSAATVRSQTRKPIKNTKSGAPKSSVSIKKNAKPARLIVAVEKSKRVKIQPNVLAAKKTKSVNTAAKTLLPVRGKAKTAPVKSVSISSKGKNKPVKLQTIAAAKKTKTAKAQAFAAPKKIKKVATKISAASKKKPAKIQSRAATEASKVSIAKSKVERRKIKPAVVVKAAKTNAAAKIESEAQGQKIFAAVKIRRQKIDFSPKKTQAAANKLQPSGNGKASKTSSKDKGKTVENKIDAPESVVVEKPKKRKAKAIGAAVFRGRRERYDFQVFPLDSEFSQMTAVSGIYVISKRKTDRNKRAHHALVCIGQTECVAGEVKRHQKNCIKKHKANVISILPEGNEKRRLKIEEDLKSAHSIACGIS